MKKLYIKGWEKKALRLKNTGDLIFCDDEHWEKARHVLWYYREDGKVVNKAGFTFEEYVGIVDRRANAPWNDFRS